MYTYISLIHLAATVVIGYKTRHPTQNMIMCNHMVNMTRTLNKNYTQLVVNLQQLKLMGNIKYISYIQQSL